MESSSRPDLTDASIDYKIILFKYFYWQVVKIHDNDWNSKLKILHKFIQTEKKNPAYIDFWGDCGQAG